MKAEIINTGTELFFDEISNINLAYLSNHLIEIGWEPIFHTTVPDNLNHLIIALHTALKRARLVIVTGGLGPTSDDLTRFAVAIATKRELHFNRGAYQTVESYFKRVNRLVPPINRVQAEIPAGAIVIPNRLGTAPGFRLKIRNKTIIALPGVPDELKDMFERHLLKQISRRAGKPTNLISSKFLIFGISEARLQEQINNLELPPEVTVGITAANNGVLSLRLFIKSKTRERSKSFLAETLSLIKGCLGKLIFGSEEDTIENVAGKMLLARKYTIAVAESCTGGLLSHRLTNIPGVSSSFKEGLVCYSNESKIKRLGIPARIIKRYGAVSAEVAGLMARNIARNKQTDLGIAITGIAGPSGGTPDKPVGLVYIAIHSSRHRRASSRHGGAGGNHLQDEVIPFQFTGLRLMIKERAVATALNLLRLRLLKS